jgi:hypothetical protein
VDPLRQDRHHDLMVKAAEAVGDVALDEPVRPLPDLHDLAERGVAAPARAKPVGPVGELGLVVGLQQQADHLGDQLVRPGRQAQRAQLPVGFRDVDPLDRPPPVALGAQRVDDRPDLGQRHAVHGLRCDPRRHRTLVGGDAPVGQQEQLRVEQLPIQPLKWQSPFTTLADDVQHRCGALHYAYLALLDPLITCAPSPCGRLSRPPWWDVAPTTTTGTPSP